MHPTRKPSLPGEVLQELYLAPLNLPLPDFARSLGVEPDDLTLLIHGEARVAPEMAQRLANVLQTSPELWLNLQHAVDHWQAAQDSQGQDRLADAS